MRPLRIPTETNPVATFTLMSGYVFVEPAEVIDPNRCTGCGLCFRMCPDMAIEIRRTPSKAGSEVAG